MNPIAYGIDFGTTNSSIAVAHDEGVEVLDVSGQGIPEILPSIVYLHRDGIQAAGEDAIRQYLVTGSRMTRCGACLLVDRSSGQPYTDCRQYRRGGGCQDARIATELKSFLADDSVTSTHSWARDFDLPEFVSTILRELKRSADRTIGADIRRAVIGYPVLFVGAEGVGADRRQRLALDRLVEAARRAGFAEVDFLEEPAAAVVDDPLERGVVVVVDFGGGTFDVAVVDLDPEQGEVMALQGAAIGGEHFTGLLFESKVAPALGLDGSVYGIPAWLRVRLRTLAGVLRVLSDRDAPGLLRSAAQSAPQVAILERILYGGFAYHFYRAIEEAKVELSSEERTSIQFHRPEIDVSIPVTRGEFERTIAPDLEIVRERILAAIGQAGVDRADVRAVLRTGGTSSIPAFVKLLDDLFGSSKVRERPVYTTVVNGLAAYARGRWAA